MEKDKVIEDLRTALDDMKRKAEQGSMETQGEVLEQDFRGPAEGGSPPRRHRTRPQGNPRRRPDPHRPNADGRGLREAAVGDQEHEGLVRTWIPKPKDDMIEIRATVAVLVSVVLPEGINASAGSRACG